MKRKNIARLLLLLSLVFVFGACSDRKKVIGVSQCSNDLWRKKVNQEIRIGQYQYKNVDIIITSADNDAQKQVRQIDSLVRQKVDLLVVAPSDIKTVAPAIKRVYRSGIPVILYDRKIESPYYTAYIGGDNVEIGREVARFIANRLKGEGTVVEITGIKGSSPVIDRHAGFMQVMKKQPGIKVVTLEADWNVEGARQVMEKYLAEGNRADAVFGHNDAEATGAMLATKDRKLDKNIIFVGVDGLPGKYQGVDRVLRGELTASYVYPTKGEMVVPLAMKILEGKPYCRDNYMQSYFATAQNAKLIAAQYQEMEDKVRELDNIYDSIDSYQSMTRKLSWTIVLVVLLLVGLVAYVCYAYVRYRRKSRLRKQVATAFLDSKEKMPDELTQLDETERYFIDRFKKKVVENLADPNLKMSDLGSEMQLSRAQLYRKVKAMTGKTPAELLREMRLQKAYILVQQTDKSVAEIATEVGFAVPGYFSACFKKRYGMLPSDMRNEMDKK